MKLKTLITTATVALFALTACSQDTEPPTEPAPESAQDQAVESSQSQDPASDIEYQLGGEYFFYGHLPSVVGKFELPSEPHAEAEELRQQANASEVTYITVTIDNREGIETQNLSSISAFDKNGQQYEFVSLPRMADEWSDQADEWLDGYTELWEENSDGASAGEVIDYTVAYDGTDLPEELERLDVHTGGNNEPVAALPADHPESEYVDLDFEAPDSN